MCPWIGSRLKCMSVWLFQSNSEAKSEFELHSALGWSWEANAVGGSRVCH